MRARGAVAATSALCAFALLGARVASPESGPTLALPGVLRGCTIVIDPFAKWKEADVRAGILGTLTGPARDFERIEIEVGGDRSIATAAQRLAYEADRVQRRVMPGEMLKEVSVRSDVSVVRYKHKDAVFACAARQMGRSVLFVRAQAAFAEEAALCRLLTGLVGTAKVGGDDVDGWVPWGVKVAWNRALVESWIVADDGQVEGEVRDEALRRIREAYEVVRRVVPGSPVFPGSPVVRFTANRDLFLHLGHWRSFEGHSAFVPGVAELMVCPDGRTIDEPQLLRAGVEQALHHLLGARDAEPLRTGFARYAQATVRAGGKPGDFLPADAEKSIQRAKSHAARSWGGILLMPTLVGYDRTDQEDTRGIDAELAVHYLMQSAGPIGKTTLSRYVDGFRKVGHPDAAAEAVLREKDFDRDKTDAEYWKYWDARLSPGKGKKPGGK